MQQCHACHHGVVFCTLCGRQRRPKLPFKVRAVLDPAIRFDFLATVLAFV
jgi:hypothetical protein